MKTLLVFVICLAAVASSYAGQIATGPVQQIGTTNQQTGAWERDKWQPNKRFNAIDPKTGIKTGGFIERDTWEPSKRFNVYDSNGQYKGKLQRDIWQGDRYNYTPAGDETGGYGSGTPEFSDGIGTVAP